MMSQEFLGVDDVTRLLNVSESTVRRWIRTGKLQGQKAGGQWRFQRNLVIRALEQGLLSGATNPANPPIPLVSRVAPPVWATRVLATWKDCLQRGIRELQPDHVVVNDRRGAKIWQIVMPGAFSWGENLWHSTAIRSMEEAELRRIFTNRTVLLFDEMMRHGRAMRELRQMLERARANVKSFVCICSKSHLESGKTLESRARICEILSDKEFGRRATMISRLVGLSSPPLDADHLVVRGRMENHRSPEYLVRRLANWGRAFVVTYPDADHELLAVTLDRPQFFDSAAAGSGCEFRVFWDGPCKVRFYIDWKSGDCSFVFIAYPRIVGSTGTWAHYLSGDELSPVGELTGSSAGGHLRHMSRIYETVCIDLAIRLLQDFKASGAADDVGASLVNTPDALDIGQLRATFGPSRATDIEKQVRRLLSQSHAGKGLFSSHPEFPPLLAIREPNKSSSAPSYDASACRRSLLDSVPSMSVSDPSGRPEKPPIPYSVIVRTLATYSETVIGQVFDYELDWGTMKPSLYFEHRSDKEGSIMEVGRGVYRGEYDPPFTLEVNSFHTYDDTMVRHTLAMCPAVLKLFLERIGKSDIGATHFAKLFANLKQDWQEDRFVSLCYSLQPYKYGPVPVVGRKTSAGGYVRLADYLRDEGCIIESRTPHGSMVRRTFRPDESSRFPWPLVYDTEIDGGTKAFLSGLVRLYATISNTCQTARLSRQGASDLSIFQDALVVLASARNQRVTYECGLFELEDWCEKSEKLLKVLTARARLEQHDSVRSLAPTLRSFAEPAALLFAKIQMYRNIPFLRQQIEKLRDSGELEMAHAVLETIDEEPCIENGHDYPIGALEWAYAIIHPFSSLLRQVLAQCDPDLDNRPTSKRFDTSGTLKDASYYLAELLRNAPELEPLHADLQECIRRTSHGRLTAEIAESLSRALQLILGLFEAGGRIPRCAPQYNSISLEPRGLPLIVRLQDVPLSDPYAVAIVNTKTFTGMARYLSLQATNNAEEIAASLHAQLSACASEACEMSPDVHFAGQTADAVVLAGPNPDTVFLCVLDLMKRAARVMAAWENSLATSGLMKAGIAWHQRDLGSAYHGVEPGTISHSLSDTSGRDLGDIAISTALLERLSIEHRGQFSPVAGEQCEQGQVYVRRWDRNMDVRLSI